MGRVLVIGGGPAGLAGAVKLAAQDQEVIILEKSECLGGKPGNFTCKALEKCSSCGACLTAELTYKIDAMPSIRAVTGATLINITPSEPGYEVSYEDGGLHKELVDSILIAVGFELFDTSRIGEYGYGRSPRVLTSLELDMQLHDCGVEILGPMPRIAFIQCVGSRDLKRGVPYCSRICCLYTEKMTNLILDRAEGSMVDVFFMDRQKYPPIYKSGQINSINYIRSMPARVETVNSGELLVKYEEDSQCKQGLYDWVVLCPAVVPGPGSQKLCHMLDLEIDSRGFIRSFNNYETSQKGMFIAGGCTGPKTILESINEGRIAATYLLKDLGIELP